MPPIRYLSIAEFAARIGISPKTLKRYHLPEPDSLIGRYRGWLPETIDQWQAQRPGSPGRTGPRPPTASS
jgi:predicted DNA-binding transcriptional regulator AlpA